MDQVITSAGRDHLRLALCDGIGPIRFAKLLEHFGDVSRVLGASATALAGVQRVGRDTAERIARSRDAVDVEGEAAACAELGVRIVCLADPDYPPGLRRIPDAPVCLWIRGELRPTDVVAMAVVGSRRCSIYGSEQARRFGELLAGAGFTVVSGLARGVDAFAQHGAVDAGGRSLAVLGSGLGSIYPPENEQLAQKILAAGAWISELPLRSSIRAENFPSRNRIIAGMSLGTLIVEAAARSGALITARLASEYNRDVFAIPGRLQESTAVGTNALIRDGSAKLVTCLEDILDELGDVGRILKGFGVAEPPMLQPASAVGATSGVTGPISGVAASPGDLFNAGGAAAATATLSTLSETERRVWESISSEPRLQDDVIALAGVPAGEALAAFTALELRGMIRRMPGQRVSRREK